MLARARRMTLTGDLLGTLGRHAAHHATRRFDDGTSRGRYRVEGVGFRHERSRS
jgi:hypothetical protein